MKGPALKIVLGPGKGGGKAPPSEGEESGLSSYEKPEPEEGDDDLDGAAKREALGKLATALGLKVENEDAALEALETLIYHCSEG